MNVLTRRQAMQFAAAIAAGTVTLPKSTGASPLLQPLQFAEDLSGYLTYEMARMSEVGALEFQAAPMRAEFNQAEMALKDAMPELCTLPYDHPYVKMQEAVIAWVNEAYATGARHGAAIEQLRQELVGPVAECPMCWGWGAVEDDPQGRAGWPINGKPRHICETCRGAGTVPAALVDGLKQEREVNEAAREFTKTG
jgi:hypothetical protein